ncbi:MAG TPA: transcriptional regulator GcvA [Polyangiaceae bacterium]|nr:transcriptional regulator GcvA [Polyangiaceae bacterium]
MRPPTARPCPLPSLNALLAFETAARLMSFTRAASELGVTQTAVSHQIRTLENDLGTTLFRRSPQRVALTEDGQRWSTELTPIFKRLYSVNAELRRPELRERPHVAVSLVPSLGSRWLVPKLGRFIARHPDVDVRISANERLVDFAVEPIDIGIRYGSGRYPGLVVKKLADAAFVVVAAPALLARQPVMGLQDLKHAALLHDDHPDAWAGWFRARRARLPNTVRMHQYTDSAMLVEAVLREQGIGLARWSLVVDELMQGRLKLVFPKIAPLPTGLAYYLVTPRENLRRPPVAAFSNWLLSEASGLVPRRLRQPLAI